MSNVIAAEAWPNMRCTAFTFAPTKAALRAASAEAPRWGPALRALRALRAPHRTPAG